MKVIVNSVNAWIIHVVNRTGGTQTIALVNGVEKPVSNRCQIHPL